MITVAIVALLLGWGVARVLVGYPAPEQRYACLSRQEAALLAAAADATFPPGGPIPLSGSRAGTVAYVDAYLVALPPRNRVLIHLLLALVEHATLVFPGPGLSGFRRFSSLTPAQQMAVLESWGRSRLRVRRLVFSSLRTVLTMAYLANPEVLRRIQLAPLAFDTPVIDADLLFPAIGQSRASIDYRLEDRTPVLDAKPLDPRGPLHPEFVGSDT